MKKVIISLLLLAMFTQHTFACMPYNKSEIIVGNFENEYSSNFPKDYFHENKQEVIAKYVGFTNLKKPFGDTYGEIGKYFFYDFEKLPDTHKGQKWTKIENVDDFKKGDTVIMVSDYQNGDFEKYFTINAIAKLECSGEKLQIISPRGYDTSWDKSMWQCGNFKPHNVLSKEELLKTLEKKYHFCNKSEQKPEEIQTENIFIKLVSLLFKMFI